MEVPASLPGRFLDLTQDLLRLLRLDGFILKLQTPFFLPIRKSIIIFWDFFWRGGQCVDLSLKCLLIWEPIPLYESGEQCSGKEATYLFSRLESLALTKQGFWQSRFCRKHNIWSLCCDGIKRAVFLCNVCMGKRISADKFIFHPSVLLYAFPFPQESNAEKHQPISSITTKTS